MTQVVAETKQLVKTYDQAGTPIPVLKSVDFKIVEGETVAIVGESGSGKSTFLSLLSGLDFPTRGLVSWIGQNILELDEAQLALLRARNLGIVFQQFHLMSFLTALQNVSLPLEILQTPHLNGAHLAKEALERVGLSHRLHHLPHQMSGGEKQRVAIARAFVTRPKLLLADEPSGSLDPRTGERVLELLFEQARSFKMALVLVTHNEKLARKCQRQLRLEDGRLLP